MPGTVAHWVRLRNPATMCLMDYREWDTSNCSVGRAVEVVGQTWVILILREVSQGIRRFTEMQDRLGGSRSALSDRPDRLVCPRLPLTVPDLEPGHPRPKGQNPAQNGQVRDAPPTPAAAGAARDP